MQSLLNFQHVDRLLCLGAHPDDIELGAAGLIMRLVQDNPALRVQWVVFCGADEDRAAEARNSAALLCDGLEEARIELLRFRDAYLPSQRGELKDVFESLKGRFDPDLVLTHYSGDRHQDHRQVSELTWNTWRDHSILEYEVLKWDGDLGRPNLYLPLTEELAFRKASHSYQAFLSQHSRRWFTEETFLALMRVRGVECNAEYAEAFYAPKLVAPPRLVP